MIRTLSLIESAAIPLLHSAATPYLSIESNDVSISNIQMPNLAWEPSPPPSLLCVNLGMGAIPASFHFSKRLNEVSQTNDSNSSFDKNCSYFLNSNFHFELHNCSVTDCNSGERRFSKPASCEGKGEASCR